MDAYLLGAGFSKAMHPGMPTMAELRERILERLGLEEDDLAPFRHDVEVWLSYLSSPQPWDTEDTQLTNQARFLQASRAVHEVVQEASPTTWDELTTDSQDTLLRLTHQWATGRAAVLSFNYDLIVELALRQELAHYRERDVYALPLTSRKNMAGFNLGEPVSDELRPTVYKLHGSTNWLYSGTTDPHAPIVLRELTDEQHLYDDLHPLIVPPTSSKSSFYSNGALRAQWRNAFAHLRRAERLIIMGYSMPTTDLQIQALLGLALPDTTEVLVVDHNPDIAQHIGSLLPRHEVSDRYTGDGAIGRFVEEHCDYVAHWHRTGYPEGTQHLRIHGRSRTRPWSHDLTGPEPTQEAVHALARSWPSIDGHWRTVNTGDGGARLHVSRADYRACPDPWETDEVDPA